MAGNLRIHANVVERAGHDRDEDRSNIAAVLGGRAIVTALTSRYGPDDEPYQHDDTSDSHMYLRERGRSGRWNESRTWVVSTTTAAAADIHRDGFQYVADSTPRDTHAFPVGRFECRGIVTADGLGCEDRGRGKRISARPACSRARRRRSAGYPVAR